MHWFPPCVLSSDSLDSRVSKLSSSTTLPVKNKHRYLDFVDPMLRQPVNLIERDKLENLLAEMGKLENLDFLAALLGHFLHRQKNKLRNLDYPFGNDPLV